MYFLFTIHDILGENISESLFVLLNLVIIESLLSVDSAFIATGFISRLKHESQKNAALKITFGLVLVRAITLLFASWLIKIWWLQFFLGIGLLVLGLRLTKKESTSHNWMYISGAILATSGMFSYSIDSVFAAVAFTDNMYLIYIGVFIGILSMYLIMRISMRLQRRYPLFSTLIAAVLILKGIYYLAGIVCHFSPDSDASRILYSEITDLSFSLLILASSIGIRLYYFFRKEQNNKSSKSI